MSLVIAVPLLLLIAACIVMVGSERSLYERAKLAAYAIGAAFAGAIAILFTVVADGPITVRFYDPTSVASVAFPFGFYVDRRGAVMMTLITGVTTVVYCYSTGYMYQDRHYRRYLAIICCTDF